MLFRSIRRLIVSAELRTGELHGNSNFVRQPRGWSPTPGAIGCVCWATLETERHVIVTTVIDIRSHIGLFSPRINRAKRVLGRYVSIEAEREGFTVLVRFLVEKIASGVSSIAAVCAVSGRKL